MLCVGHVSPPSSEMATITCSPSLSCEGNVAAGANSLPDDSGSMPWEISRGQSAGIGTICGAVQLLPSNLQKTGSLRTCPKSPPAGCNDSAGGDFGQLLLKVTILLCRVLKDNAMRGPRITAIVRDGDNHLLAEPVLRGQRRCCIEPEAYRCPRGWAS